jgi:hypothetical protein
MQSNAHPIADIREVRLAHRRALMHTIIRFVTIAVVVCAVVAPARGETIQQNKKHQERRIENGEKSGRLSPEEAQRLQNKENAINKEEADMKPPTVATSRRGSATS